MHQTPEACATTQEDCKEMHICGSSMALIYLINLTFVTVTFDMSHAFETNKHVHAFYIFAYL